MHSKPQDANSVAKSNLHELSPSYFLRTVSQFSERHRAFTQLALRNLVFKATPRNSSKGEIPGNGLLECGAIIRLGRKILIDEERFFQWVQAQQKGAK